MYLQTKNGSLQVKFIQDTHTDTTEHITTLNLKTVKIRMQKKEIQPKAFVMHI